MKHESARTDQIRHPSPVIADFFSYFGLTAVCQRCLWSRCDAKTRQAKSPPRGILDSRPQDASRQKVADSDDHPGTPASRGDGVAWERVGVLISLSRAPSLFLPFCVRAARREFKVTVRSVIPHLHPRFCGDYKNTQKTQNSCWQQPLLSPQVRVFAVFPRPFTRLIASRSQSRTSAITNFPPPL